MFDCREQIAMSRGLTDLPMVVMANKVDLVKPDSNDKYRHELMNKVENMFVPLISITENHPRDE